MCSDAGCGWWQEGKQQACSQRDPGVYWDANHCLQPILSLLTMARWSEVLITFALCKKTYQRKRHFRSTAVCCCTFWLALLFFFGGIFWGWRWQRKEGLRFWIVLIFFNAPYGLFINWKTSNCEVDDDVQLQPVPNQVVGSTCSSECEPLPPT